MSAFLACSASAADARHQLVQHALALAVLVARMQRRQLDRDARDWRATSSLRSARRCARSPRRRRGNSAGRRPRCGRPRPACRRSRCSRAPPCSARAVQRLVDVAAEHELVAEHPHRLGHGAAHHRLAGATDQPPRGARDVPVAAVVLAQHLAGQHQRPGGGVDERRAALAQVRGPSRPRRSCRGSARRRCGVSGTRSSASARHISATPSSVDRPYSARKTSIRPGRPRCAQLATRAAASASIRRRAASIEVELAQQPPRSRLHSSSRWARRTRWRSSASHPRRTIPSFPHRLGEHRVQPRVPPGRRGRSYAAASSLTTSTASTTCRLFGPGAADSEPDGGSPVDAAGREVDPAVAVDALDQRPVVRVLRRRCASSSDAGHGGRRRAPASGSGSRNPAGARSQFSASAASVDVAAELGADGLGTVAAQDEPELQRPEAPAQRDAPVAVVDHLPVSPPEVGPHDARACAPALRDRAPSARCSRSWSASTCAG